MSERHYTPCVIIPGIGQSKTVLVDSKGNKIKNAWPVDINGDEIISEMKGPLMKLMLFHKEDAFSDKIESLVRKTAQPLQVKPDGTMKNATQVVSFPHSLEKCTADEKRFIYKMVPMQGLTEIIGENNLYFFAYNSFGQPYESAAELDKFIQIVKSETGSEKVNLVPVSLGGALCTAYLDAYGEKNDIERVMYFVAALDGTQLIADVIDRNIVPEKGLALVAMLANEKTAQSLESLTKLVSSSLPSAIINKALNALLEDVILNCPSMWSVVPSGEYKRLADKYIDPSEKALLRQQTDRFFNAQSHLREIIEERRKNGTEFFAVCGYGLPLVAISASDTLSSDSIINVSSSSLGAKAAPLGSTLTDTKDGRVCTNEAHNHISPDGTIDAAFGFMPDTTWYFSGQKHDDTAYNNTALEVAKRVLSDKSFADVYSDELLPQFGTAQDNRK